VRVEQAYVALGHGDTSALDLDALHGNQRVWAQALDAAQKDHVATARALLRSLFRSDHRWRESVRAYGERGLFPYSAELLADEPASQ
jgi:hypothetical protein